eukprot:TRINITY_DN23281_c0_g10_i1.p1 TRINITY_DN23281_c0_g10~~TRINITY_DN23281_c0_g10_i1.p1  ORF type:complete len:630 (-),score=84.88 TRINITY_DN23281_c0_g10_i1:106-1995(-)
MEFDDCAAESCCRAGSTTCSSCPDYSTEVSSRSSAMAAWDSLRSGSMSKTASELSGDRLRAEDTPFSGVDTRLPTPSSSSQFRARGQSQDILSLLEVESSRDAGHKGSPEPDGEERRPGPEEDGRPDVDAIESRSASLCSGSSSSASLAGESFNSDSRTPQSRRTSTTPAYASCGNSPCSTRRNSVADTEAEPHIRLSGHTPCSTRRNSAADPDADAHVNVPVGARLFAAACAENIDRLHLDTVTYLVEGVPFEIDKRYRPLQPVGRSLLGIACLAHDDEEQQDVTLHKLQDVYEHITITKSILRELRLLRHLRHENVQQLQHIFIAGTKHDCEDIYVVSEPGFRDLESVMASPAPLSDAHVRFFLYQILRGMKYVHSAKVVHRDLKPRNLLVNEACELQIAGFRSAQVHFPNGDRSSSCSSSGTRWYRAPESLGMSMDNSFTSDSWSVGCIFAEMLTGKTLFPGENIEHQFVLTVSVLGVPAESEIAASARFREFMSFLPAAQTIVSFSPPPRRDKLKVALTGVVQDAVDFLENVLHWAPDRRPTMAEMLCHPYLDELHCAEDEPERRSLDVEDFEYERRKVCNGTLREELFREVLTYYPSLLRRYQRAATLDRPDTRACRPLGARLH